MDAQTGRVLEGAEVTVAGTGQRTTTARAGDFELRGVPAGAQKITVSYPGVDIVSQSVTVARDQPAKVAIRVGQSSEVITLTAFKVTSAKEGMAAAVAVQKASPNFKVVAASDQYGDVSQGNAAEYLRNLPGVSVGYNANDARQILLRGMNSAFTFVTMNGNPISSPVTTNNGTNSNFEFESLSITNIETIEVIKTVTPDLHASATAGAVNLVTKSGFDRVADEFSYRVYLSAQNSELNFKRTPGWNQEKQRKILPGVDLNFSRRLRENLGLHLNYKNSSTYSDYPRSTYTRLYNPANGASPDNPWTNRWQLQNEQKLAVRQALAAQLDYKISDRTKLSINAQWNFFDMLTTDRVLNVSPGTPSATGLATGASVSYGSDGNLSGRAGQGTVTLDTIEGDKKGTTYHSGASLTHRFDDGSKFDAGTYWSKGYVGFRDSPNGFYGDGTLTQTGLTIRLLGVNETIPRVEATDATGARVDLRDLSRYTLTTLGSGPRKVWDDKQGLALNYARPLGLGFPATVKIGGRIDNILRSTDVINYRRNGTIATGAQLAAVTDASFADSSIGLGAPALNFLDVHKAYDQFGGYATLPYQPANDLIARFDDTTKAAYIRFDVTPVKDLLFVGGVRYENHATDSENRLSTTTPATLIAATNATRGYYPSFNLKYIPTRQLVVRGGYSKTISYPNFLDLVPGPATINQGGAGRGSISIYNPGIKPYKVDNLDLGAEYYLSNNAVISAAVFQKKLSNWVTTVTQTLDAATLTSLGITSGQLTKSADQYDVTTKFNVRESAKYTGIELAYAQNFSFLPKPFNTLALQLNATALKVDPISPGTVFSNNAADPNLNAALLEAVNWSLEQQQTKRMFNVVVSYAVGRLNFTLVHNYTGPITRVSARNTIRYANETVNRYFFEQNKLRPRPVTDLRIDYRWSRRFTPYLQIRNLTATEFRARSQQVPLQHFEAGDPSYELGVRGVW
ncbi:MAG: TonB-dependent receptor [Opitutus sp.]|nr:TonB-dependent receptor [Opitutus sp.]